MSKDTKPKILFGLEILFWTVIVGVVIYVLMYGFNSLKQIFSNFTDYLGNAFSPSPAPPITTEWNANLEAQLGAAPDSSIAQILGGTPNIPGFGTSMATSQFGTTLQQDQ